MHYELYVIRMQALDSHKGLITSLMYYTEEQTEQFMIQFLLAIADGYNVYCHLKRKPNHTS